MTKQAPERPVNRRFVARTRRDAAYQRQVWIGIGVTLGLTALILIGGLIYQFTIYPNQPVAVVNGVEISRADYQKRVLYERLLIDEQQGLVLAQLEQVRDAFEGQNDLIASFEQQAQSQFQQLGFQRESANREVLDRMIEEELVMAEAAARGISVSEAEVEEAYNLEAALRAGGYTEAVAEETVTARNNATATAALFTPTPTPTPDPEADAEEAAAPVETPTPAPTPTISVISGSALSDAVSTWESTIATRTDLTPNELREVIRRDLLRTRLIESFAQEVPTTELQTRASHIIVETPEEARAAIARLNDGEDFAEVAQQISTDGAAANGGDLGWFGEGDMVPEFQEAAFNIEPGTYSQEPIQTQFGWHVILVTGREERELSEADLDQASFSAYNDWLTIERTAVQDFWTIDDTPPERDVPAANPSS